MCNLSDVVEERGIEQGFSEGRREGRLEGRLEGKLEGKLEGRMEGLIALVNTLKSFVGDDTEKIIAAVRNNKEYADVSDDEILKLI